MARFDDVARDRTDLSEADLDHLRALVADWTLLSDLAFADLVLWLPTWHGGGFVAADQVRPTTGPTVLFDDIVGQYAARGRRPLLDRAVAARAVVADRGVSGPAPVEAIPVIRSGRLLGVVERHSGLSGRDVGALEQHYLEAADELAVMVVDGTFPPAQPLARTGSPPRVGDGLVRVDPDGMVVFASPNARSAYHRLGLATDLLGVHLARTSAKLARRPGPVDEALAVVASGRAAGGAEVENAGAVVTLRGVPLRRSGVHVGALVLVRDATEIRRRDRQILSKDATIREIHHRVKNNLQTVAALLRLQARRIDTPEARAALEEAVRRVGAIAAVHETLAHTPGEKVDADEIADRLVALVRDMAVTSRAVSVTRVGSFGILSAEVVTPLAMALGELLQNAVEHGKGADVRLVAAREDGRLSVSVDDEGPGLPEGADPFATHRLGLQIVRTLVTEELGGTLELGPGPDGRGTRAQVVVPLGR
ncbi:MAG: PAS domain-containing protein [Frankiales bacterium]|nr:PAS domain-containing protein [Frankiales bacterium]